MCISFLIKNIDNFFWWGGGVSGFVMHTKYNNFIYKNIQNTVSYNGE